MHGPFSGDAHYSVHWQAGRIAAANPKEEYLLPQLTF
jgi:hypothetical protein